QNPHKILLEDLKLSKGDSLLDLGCGTGFLTIPASKIVDRKGVVYAVDNNSKYLDKLRRRVTELGLENVRIINSDAASLNGIKDCSVSKAVMMLSLHHFSYRERALQEAYSKIAENGVLLINEPIKQRTLGHGTDYREMLSIAESIGFKLETLVVKSFTWKALLRK
ncbi:MAG TPA: class I SAM-dependent methyltransferase, partial [Candidatus Caldiarchaeum subterraneum]|nr:class I SAM-dependent methyltransferase [Candidatus Caldarchaeum subterraneum]